MEETSGGSDNEEEEETEGRPKWMRVKELRESKIDTLAEDGKTYLIDWVEFASRISTITCSLLYA